jgi:FdhD protein
MSRTDRSVGQRPVHHLVGAGVEAVDDADALDALVVEEPLEIRVADETVAVTMRTPGHDRQLALGFLYAEGVVRTLRDVGSVAVCGRPGEDGYGNVINVAPGPGAALDLDRVAGARRGTLSTAACGVCGRRTIDDLLARCPPCDDPTTIDARTVHAAFAQLRASQPVFARTGGVHAAGLFAADGAPRAVYEDVGRHNAVDKLVGHLLLEDALPAWGSMLLVSGRSSFEIVQKAAMARIAVVASVSAPSTLAVDLAARLGITLLGFVRGERMNVYAGRARVRAG